MILRNTNPKINQANVLKDSEPSILGVLLSPFIFSTSSFLGIPLEGANGAPSGIKGNLSLADRYDRISLVLVRGKTK